MLDVHRTYRAKICNHSQVAEMLDRHGWSASKLWNVTKTLAFWLAHKSELL
jgi:putative transposase